MPSAGYPFYTFNLDRGNSYMSFYNSEFFAGCESLMEDDTNLPAEDLPVEEAVVEQQEAADNAKEVVEDAAAIEETQEAAEQMLAKFDEIDRMTAYIEQYGVDKSFLSLCNSNDILNRSFGLGLPATESFDEDGDPNSAVSQAAMEGLKEAGKAVWDWIKKIWTKIKNFVSNLWNKFIGWFSKDAEKTKKDLEEASNIKKKPENEKSEKEKAAGDKDVIDPKVTREIAAELSKAASSNSNGAETYQHLKTLLGKAANAVRQRSKESSVKARDLNPEELRALIPYIDKMGTIKNQWKKHEDESKAAKAELEKLQKTAEALSNTKGDDTDIQKIQYIFADLRAAKEKFKLNASAGDAADNYNDATSVVAAQKAVEKFAKDLVKEAAADAKHMGEMVKGVKIVLKQCKDASAIYKATNGAAVTEAEKKQYERDQKIANHKPSGSFNSLGKSAS
jgi:hypothetical protein